uniref:Uncharacterized protein n=1 Tax=Physcomitrium patens TaxID=3218 RepID=A0A7I4E6A1_PHYPA
MLVSDKDVLAAVLQLGSSKTSDSGRPASFTNTSSTLFGTTPVQFAHCAIAAFELAFSMHAMGFSDEKRKLKMISFPESQAVYAVQGLCSPPKTRLFGIIEVLAKFNVKFLVEMQCQFFVVFKISTKALRNTPIDPPTKISKIFHHANGGGGGGTQLPQQTRSARFLVSVFGHVTPSDGSELDGQTAATVD